MTLRDYVAIAAVLADSRSHVFTNGRNDVHATIALKLADMMAADNPRFDRKRFLAACGVQS